MGEGRDKIKLSHAVFPKPHIIVRKEKNCYLLVNRENGVVLAVNDVGIAIWQQMSSKVTVEKLIQKIMEKFNVNFEISKRETIRFIENLLEGDFVEIKGEA